MGGFLSVAAEIAWCADNSTAEMVLPESIHERAREAGVFGFGNDIGELFEPRSLFGIWIDSAQLWINEFQVRLFSRGPVAANIVRGR